MKNDLISIIMPVYNAEKYVACALDSLISQTYVNIEVLCVNDGSVDSSWDILQKYAQADSRIKIFTQENSGPAQARNVAIEKATGKYLMFCDADDWYEPTMCEEMIGAMLTQNVDLVMCNPNIIEADKNHYRDQGDIDYLHIKQVGYSDLDDLTKANLSVLLWNKMFKLDKIRQYKILFQKGSECEDTTFIFQYLAVAKSLFSIDKKLYNYRLLGDSLMGKFFSNKGLYKIYDMLYALSFSVKFMYENNLLNENIWIKNVLVFQISWALGYLDEKEKIKFLTLFNKDVLCYFSPDELKDFHILKLLENKKYKEALKYQNYQKKYHLFGITLMKIKVSDTGIRYNLLGLPVFSIKIKKAIKRYCIFGLPLFRVKL